jgi:O-acetyl-ADP-ribose deacetylase (regulator of RNase III)
MSHASHRSERWTHPSVRAFSGSEDPVATLVAHARHIVRQAMDAGWSGPPFDPIALAELLKIPVTPRDDVADARTVPAGRSGVRIEFNPSRPAQRVRYSLAHEIAHTFFPDCAEHVRNRAAYHEMTGDDWQLEALCNIGAAELLMPAGSLHELAPEGLTLEHLLQLRAHYAVSTEAMLIRATRMSEEPTAMFCASSAERGARTGGYHLDYMIGSPAWTADIQRGLALPPTSVVRECVAIGFTATGREEWRGIDVDVQCVGIPGYPGRLLPRVVGILRPRETTTTESGPTITYVRGDATKPRGKGARIVTHIVNDATPNWGGQGFAAALRRTFPEAQQGFRVWAASERERLKLGQTHYTQVSDEFGVFHMIAQHGYGPSEKPRIRYTALDSCLRQLGAYAADMGASVHAPRIGTGQAGGAWDVVRDMLLEHVCARGVSVTVYDPPGRRMPTPEQPSLSFSRAG